MPSIILAPAVLQCLGECRERVCKELGLDPTDVELSMGMSGDFEQAVCIHSDATLVPLHARLPNLQS